MKNYPVLFLEHFINHERRNRGTTNNGEGRNATTFFFWEKKTTGFWVCNNNQFGFCLKTNLKKTTTGLKFTEAHSATKTTPQFKVHKKNTHTKTLYVPPGKDRWRHSHVLGNISDPLPAPSTFTLHHRGSPQKTDRTSPSNDPLTPSLKLPACPSGSILDVGRKLSGIPSLKAGATPAKPKDSGPSKGAGPVSRDGGVGIFGCKKHTERLTKNGWLIWKLVDVPKKKQNPPNSWWVQKGVWGVQRPFFPHKVFGRLGVDGFFSWLMKPGVFRQPARVEKVDHWEVVGKNVRRKSLQLVAFNGWVGLRLPKGSNCETHFDHLYLEPETST